MEQTQTLTMFREQTDNQVIFSRYYRLIYIGLGFIVGQAVIGEAIYILPLVYWSLFLRNNRLDLSLVTITTAWGLYWAGGWTGLFFLLSGCLGWFLATIILRFKQNRIILPLFMGGSYLIFAMADLIFVEAMVYQYLLKAGEAIILVLLIYITSQLREEVNITEHKEWIFSRAGRLPLVIIVCSFIIGLSGLGVVLGLQAYVNPVINILILFSITGFAVWTDFYQGICLGVILGLTMLMTGVIPMVTVIRYLIFTLIAGYFGHRGKLWMLLSLVIAFLIYSGLSPTFYNLRISSYETLCLLFCYLLIPFPLLKKFFDNFNGSLVDKGVSALTVARGGIGGLSGLSQVFKDMSQVFKNASGINRERGALFEDFVYIFKNKNCLRCPRYEECWKRDKKDTYHRINQLIEEGKKLGILQKQVVKKIFGDKCPFWSRIYSGITHSYEILQINNFWKQKLLEKQQLVARQLAGVGQIVEDFASRSGAGVTLQDNAGILATRASKLGLEVFKVESELSAGNQRPIFRVKMDPCAGQEPCQNQLLQLLNLEYESSFRLIERKCGNKIKDRSCKLKYGPVGPFSLKLAVRQQAAAEVSGDNYSYQQLADGHDLIVLSDGMGVGPMAEQDSKAAITIFKDILEAGFTSELALQTINSIFFLRDYRDKFATMDIALFNTFNGDLVLKKTGAVSTFIKRGWEIEVIKPSSLPAGILKNLDCFSRTLNLNNGDMVVMLTDGMLDSAPDNLDSETWFKQLLANSSFDSAGDFADYIMEVITDRLPRIKDDMTLVIFQVIKN